MKSKPTVIVTHMCAGADAPGDEATRCGLGVEEVDARDVSILAEASTCDACLARLAEEGVDTGGAREHWRVTWTRSEGASEVIEFPNVNPHHPPSVRELDERTLAPGDRIRVERDERPPRGGEKRER